MWDYLASANIRMANLRSPDLKNVETVCWEGPRSVHTSLYRALKVSFATDVGVVVRDSRIRTVIATVNLGQSVCMWLRFRKRTLRYRCSHAIWQLRCLFSILGPVGHKMFFWCESRLCPCGRRDRLVVADIAASSGSFRVHAQPTRRSVTTFSVGWGCRT